MHDKELDKALLIACYSGSKEKDVCEEHLDELELLTSTYGVETAAKCPCPLRKIDASTYLGSGKLDELTDLSREVGANLIIFDEEISPAQQRNLEKAFDLTVMDRTELILAVFEQRAHSKEARLQVELAKVKYQIPRLKRLWTHLHRQSGSGGSGMFLKGEGEKQIEIDKRLLQKRIDQLNRDISEVEKHRETQRAARVRSGIPTFALVGYTNAGKSTLLNALTEAGVFVEDKLFATLDTTTRKFTLPAGQEILLIDTVGFIRKLPHLLVAAFKSTLEEAVQADILLHLVDVSHPMAYEQAEASLEVLSELNAEDKPVITVLNKIDQLEDNSRLIRFRSRFPHTVAVSALKKEGFEDLIEEMENEIRKRRKQVELKIPQSEYQHVSKVMEEGAVLQQDYEGNDVLLKAEVPLPLLGKLEKYIVK